MNILVTGANGFIGRRLSSRLKTRGHQVFGLSQNIPSESLSEFTQYYRQDISTPFSLKGSFDLVIHLAAYNITNVGAKNTDLYTAINVHGTRNLLQAVNTKRFIYLSTAKVYKNEGQPLTEVSPVDPLGAYEESKLKAEKECLASLKKEALVILRSVNVLGWGQARKAVLPVFFQNAKGGQPLDIIHSAQTPMQFVYVEDLVDLFVSLTHREELHGVFNIAHEESFCLEQLAEKIIAITHSSSVLNIGNNVTGALFSPVICDKVYCQTGWKANTGLQRILELYGEEYARTF